MAINTPVVLSAIVSQLKQLGHFDRVNESEPKANPGSGLSAAVWFEDLMPVRTSGLNVTSVRMQFMVRIYKAVDQGNPDLIDSKMVTATDSLLSAFNNNFTLLYNGEDMVRQVDVFGSEGDPLRARSGYIELDDTEFRIVDITLPLIIDDVWQQGGS